MIEDIITIILLGVAAERSAELVSSSKIFAWLREPISRKAFSEVMPADDDTLGYIKLSIFVFLNNLLTCGYCCSVWTAGFFACFGPARWPWIVQLLVIHGFANFYHIIYELVRRGRVATIDKSVNINVPQRFSLELELKDGSAGEGVGKASQSTS